MQNLKRSINVGFRVTGEEQSMIQRRMAQTGIRSLRAYLLKMAVDGRVIEVEMDSIRECNRLLRNISGNINQIAARANATGSVYAADMEEIKARQGEIWERQDAIIKTLAKIVEVV
jgi:hypothetical protein